MDGLKYRCIDCQMHEEAQGVDQPAQHEVVTAQQVEGHLRPCRKSFNHSSYMYRRLEGESCVKLSN